MADACGPGLPSGGGDSRTRSIEGRPDKLEILLALSARPSHPVPLAADDYISDGALGLMRAVELFDGSRGNSFLTFAGQKMRGAMIDGLRNRDHHTRPARQYARLREEIIGAFLARYGRNPTQDELRAAISKAHPDWSARRLENVVTGRTVDLEPLVRTGPNNKEFATTDAE